MERRVSKYSVHRVSKLSTQPVPPRLLRCVYNMHVKVGEFIGKVNRINHIYATVVMDLYGPHLNFNLRSNL